MRHAAQVLVAEGAITRVPNKILPFVPALHSLLLRESYVRAAAACGACDAANEMMDSLLEGVEAGDLRWAPQWDTFSLVMNACRRSRDLSGWVSPWSPSLSPIVS